MKKTVEILKTFDFASEEHHQLLANTIQDETFPGILYCIRKGKAIYRCRRNLSFEDLFFFESDISYRNDLKNIKTYGRCNEPHSSIFYGSFAFKADNGQIFNGIPTNIFEASSLYTDNLDGIESYTVGMWVAKEDFYIPMVVPEKDYIMTLGIKEYEYKAFEPQIKEVFNNPDHAEFYKVIGDEFKKKVNSSNHWEYGATAIISEVIMRRYNGVMYPSVKLGGKGMNVAFRPAKFDKYFELNQVATVEIYKIKDHTFSIYRKIVDDIKSYPFMYKPVPKEQSNTIEEIIELFNRQGIKAEVIISGLFDFIRSN